MRRLSPFCAALAALLLLPGAARSGDRPASKILINKKTRAVMLPATVAKQGTHDVLKGAIEYVLVAKGGKDYETVFATKLEAQKIHDALAKIGLTQGQPGSERASPTGKPVNIFVIYEHNGRKQTRPVDEFVAYLKDGTPLKPGSWPYTGSEMTVDPGTGKKVLKASLTGSIIGLHHTDPTPLFQNPRAESRKPNLYTANKTLLPPAGTRVRIVFRRVMRTLPKDIRRVHVFITGRVQGVGFRAFTQRQARPLKLVGWVKNLRDGRVEAVIEGKAKAVEALLAKLRRGPRAARVKDIEIRDESPEGDARRFVIER